VDDLGGIATLSDVAELPVAERTFCVESEFATRSDGFEPMLEAYGIPLGSPQGYRGTTPGSTCRVRSRPTWPTRG
jgi:osmoprotectant transport system substrate-binding protein